MNTDDAMVLSIDLVLELFDKPIAFHRCLVRVTNSVAGALMLSQAISWAEELAAHSEGWFSKSQMEWHRETGLTRWEQETARRILKDKGFLLERQIGMPARVWFCINKRALAAALLQTLDSHREWSAERGDVDQA